MTPFAEKREQLGEAIWLLFVYASLAVNDGKTQDSQCARFFGVSTSTILQWRDRLVRAGLATVYPHASGGVYVELKIGSDLRSLLDALSANGAWTAAAANHPAG